MPPVDANARLTIAQDAVVSVQAILIGRITIGSSTIVHPKATIDAGAGEIVIGVHNIIEEKARIENLGPSGSVMTIGDDNLFEVGSVCHASSIGNNNNFGIKSEVGCGVQVSDSCRIGTKCRVLTQNQLPSQTVIYFEQNNRKTCNEKPSNQRSQTEFLKKLLPKYSNILQNTQK